jgi:tRNA(Ile2) C34 agmatinyltransferase TiaS
MVGTEGRSTGPRPNLAGYVRSIREAGSADEVLGLLREAKDYLTDQDMLRLQGVCQLALAKLRATVDVRCPRCKRPTATTAAGKNRCCCHHCRMEFESEDDGDVGYGSPSRRLEREERRRVRR